MEAAQAPPYVLPISFNNSIKLIMIPDGEIQFKAVIEMIEAKLELKPTWRSQYQLLFRYQNNLYPFTKEDDIRMIMRNNVKLLIVFPVHPSNLKTGKAAPIVRTAKWQADPKRSLLGNSEKPHKVKCDGCEMPKIFGLRYKCNFCSDFNLCEKCFNQNSQKSIHKHLTFLCIFNNKEYKKESEEFFNNKIKSENLVALEMRKQVSESMAFSQIRLQLTSKVRGKKQRLLIEKEEGEASEGQSIKQEAEQEVNGKEEPEAASQEEVESVKDEDKSDESIEVVNDLEAKKRLSEMNGDYDEELIAKNLAEKKNNGIDFNDYCNLFEDKELSSEVEDLLKINKEDNHLEEKYITVNNNIRIIPMNIEYNKKWEGIEIHFETNCPDIYLFPKNTSSIDTSIRYISLNEKKIKLMFENLENHPIGSMFEYDFQLYSITSEKIIRSDEVTIVLLIK